jgi:hypothetical protein
MLFWLYPHYGPNSGHLSRECEVDFFGLDGIMAESHRPQDDVRSFSTNAQSTVS